MRTFVTVAVVVLLGAALLGLAVTAGGPVGMVVAALGFAFILILVAIFREYSLHAQLQRSLAVGESQEVIGLAQRQRRQHWAFPRNMPMDLYEAQAYEQLGKTELALRSLDALAARAALPDNWRIVAAALRLSVLLQCEPVTAPSVTSAAETLAGYRPVPRSVEGLAQRVALAHWQVAQGQFAKAYTDLAALAKHVQLGAAQRATAHALAARAAAGRDELAAAQTHLAAAQRLGARLALVQDTVTRLARAQDSVGRQSVT